jgi:hypothetical protein
MLVAMVGRASGDPRALSLTDNCWLYPIIGLNRGGVERVFGAAGAHLGARGRQFPRRWEEKMIVRLATATAAMALILGAAPSHAGPCTDRIYQTDLDVAKLLNSAAAQGGTAPQSTFATMHRQPTPGSIASAEEQAGSLTSEEVQAITEAMDEARHADGAGDLDGCEKALSDVDRMLKR